MTIYRIPGQVLATGAYTKYQATGKYYQFIAQLPPSLRKIRHLACTVYSTKATLYSVGWAFYVTRGNKLHMLFGDSFGESSPYPQGSLMFDATSPAANGSYDICAPFELNVPVDDGMKVVFAILLDQVASNYGDISSAEISIEGDDKEQQA